MDPLEKGPKDEDPVPSSSSGSSGDEIRREKSEKQKLWEQELEESERQDTITELPDDFEAPPLKKRHTRTLGILKLRADNDDDPSDWWFASTAIPLIAATFAPMANVLSIAGLVVYWRNKIVQPPGPNYDIQYQETSVGYKDPKWCTDINVASLVFGFVGNLFLLFNFTKRVRYIVALPVTIVCFYIASGLLIGATSAMNIYVPPGHNEIYSQGFWHAIIASCLYMFNSMILMVNMWGYFLGHYPQHFTLTDEQRNLILQTMMFFIWLGVGAYVFNRTEGWSYPDALYFCDVTILTIGFGDFYPTDDLGRGLVFPYSVGGTIILGLMVSSIHRFAGELSKDQVVRKHMENSRVNTLSRATTMTDEEKRMETLEQKDWRPGHRPSISSPLEQMDLPGDPEKVMGPRKVDFKEPEPQEDEDEDEPSPNQFLNSKFYKSGFHATLKAIATNPMKHIQKVRSKTTKAIIMKEEKDRFDAMRKIQSDAVKFKKWYALCLSVFAFGLLWCIGAVVFFVAEKHTQGLSYFQALYFCYVSLLTIGYGDLSPRSNAGKPFFVLWSLIAVPTMTILVSDMGDTVIASFKQGTFRLADFTVLPKDGLWRDFLVANPWLFKMLKKRGEKKKRKLGLPVGPDPNDIDLPKQTIEQLARERLNEHQLTRKLAFAIRQTADDLSHHHGKKYTYEEWVEYTRLIRFTKMDLRELEYDEDQEGVVEWDWLDDNSPMLAQQSESEWILDRLCESLLRLLKKNNLGREPELSPNNAGFRHFSFASGTRDTADDHDTNDEDPRGAAAAAEAAKKQAEAQAAMPSKTDERRMRATGADALLTFFTGDRRGTGAYVNQSPMWSKKALDKMDQRRRSSAGQPQIKQRRGPFAKLQHGGKTGAVGGGRGGAGTRTLKGRMMLGSTDMSYMRDQGRVGFGRS